MKNFFFLIFFLLLSKVLSKSSKRKTKKKTKDLFIRFIESKKIENSILISEFQNYHYECLPGLTKYFIDLGYNVDIILINGRKESMEKFEPKNKIRIFEFRNFKEINKYLKRFRKRLKDYKYIFLETFELKHSSFYKKIGYFNYNNSLFLIHHLDTLEQYTLNNSISKNRFFSISDYGIVTYLNPNYFGNFNLKHKKNDKISFFMTSTNKRNYVNIINAVKELNNKLKDFEINIVGITKKFNLNSIPKNLRKYFKFHGPVKYQKMYEIINNVDFIIINLFPNSKFDNLFRTFRATGNTQLSYGFYKPVLIEENFSSIYKFTNKTAIIFKGNNLTSAMLKAIELSYDDYENMNLNIQNLKNSIYARSLNNLKISLDSISN